MPLAKPLAALYFGTLLHVFVIQAGQPSLLVGGRTAASSEPIAPEHRKQMLRGARDE